LLRETKLYIEDGELIKADAGRAKHRVGAVKKLEW